MPKLNAEEHRLYTKDDWQEFITAMNEGRLCLIDCEIFEYFLGVLPPVYMGCWIWINNVGLVYASYGFAEGYEKITAFWQVEREGSTEIIDYWCCQTEEWNAGGRERVTQ